MCVCAQSCPTPCNPMDYSLPGSSVHGIPQVRILEWVAISSSTGSSWPRDRTHVSCIGRRVLYHSHVESWFPHTRTKKKNNPQKYRQQKTTLPCLLWTKLGKARQYFVSISGNLNLIRWNDGTIYEMRAEKRINSALSPVFPILINGTTIQSEDSFIQGSAIFKQSPGPLMPPLQSFLNLFPLSIPTDLCVCVCVRVCVLVA